MPASWSRADLAQQLHRARQNGLAALIETAAQAHGLPRAFLYAIASRESRIENVIGDGGHAVGPCQVDVRYHPLAATMKQDGTWRTQPGRLIDYAAGLLAGDRAWAQANWPEYDALKICAASYNAGRGGARCGIAEGDVDRHTTDGYAADVKDRMAVMEELLNG